MASKLSEVVRSERLCAIEKEVREVLGARVDEVIAHRLAIYVLSQRYRRLSLSQIVEDAGHGSHADVLFTLRIVKVYMAEDAALAEKVQKLCGVT